MQGHFEARKAGFRQNKDGYWLTLEVHPDELPADLLQAPLGSRLMVGYCQISDDGSGVGYCRPDETPANPDTTGMFDGKALVRRAAMLCKESMFWEFMVARYPGLRLGENFAIVQLRNVCEVQSRSELAVNREAAKKFMALEQDYEAWLAERWLADRKREKS